VLKPLISPGKYFKLSDGIGNSWCNLVSYRIMGLIENRELGSRYTFVHIPKGFEIQCAVEEINNLIEILKQPQHRGIRSL
jgi:pyrrolidone-carboxylate peptidase